MASLEKSIFTSKPFRFIVDGTTFYLPSALAAQLSKPLDNLIHGSMSEAQNGCAELSDVDEGTFVRFSQWAYTGSYVTADTNFVNATNWSAAPAAVDPPPAEESRDPAEANWEAAPTVVEIRDVDSSDYADEDKNRNDFFGAWGQPDFSARRSSPHKKRGSFYNKPAPGLYNNKSSKYALREAFIQLQYPFPENTDSSVPPKANRHPIEDYTEVFLSHACVYVFAEKYDIQPLKALAIHQLHATLAIFTLYSERVGDIVALLRYSYANTAEDGPEKLRVMLMAYVGFEMETLMNAEDFTELMEERGSLLHDVLKMVGKKVVVMGLLRWVDEGSLYWR